MGAAEGAPAIQSQVANIVVQVILSLLLPPIFQVRPEDPVITNGKTLSVIEGTEVTVTCKSYRGKPAAKVQLNMGEGEGVVHGSTA